VTCTWHFFDSFLAQPHSALTVFLLKSSSMDLVQLDMDSFPSLAPSLQKKSSKSLTERSLMVVRWSSRLPNRPIRRTTRRGRENRGGDSAGVVTIRPSQVKSPKLRPTAKLPKQMALVNLSLLNQSPGKRSQLYVFDSDLHQPSLS